MNCFSLSRNNNNLNDQLRTCKISLINIVVIVKYYYFRGLFLFRENNVDDEVEHNIITLESVMRKKTFIAF